MPVTYAQAAARGFEALSFQYVQCHASHAFGGNFWHAANALHACLDYLLRSRQPDARQLLVVGEQTYRALLSASDWWRDDYGWWGNVFLLAWSNRQALGYADPKFDPLFASLLAHSASCADSLNKAWYDTPYGNEYDHAAPGTAVFPGGVYNAPPGDQGGVTLTGRNSVTNSSFWLLCQALGAAKQSGPPVARIEAWFLQWLSLKGGGLLDDRGVVLDRPRGYVDNPDWCWTGDQGLLVRALLNAGHPDTANVIANSAIAHLTNPFGILLESPGTPGNYRADYATGKGVLLRNILRPGDPTPVDPMAGFIKANAAAVWLNRLDKYSAQFGWHWAGLDATMALWSDTTHTQPLCNLIMQAAGQDALNAALLVAPDEAIPFS